jgi:dTDP-4-dehydrorhamnose reductase
MAERWIVTGASGQLGGHVLRTLDLGEETAAVLAMAGRGDVWGNNPVVKRVDLADGGALARTVDEFRPTHVLHVGAMTSVADASERPAEAVRVNVTATERIVEVAERVGARVVFTSTDMVFDGESAPYREDDEPQPVSQYGRTKAMAEAVARQYDRGLVVRLPLMYGFACTDRATTFGNQIAALRSGKPLRLFTDEFRTPVWLADAARALVMLARSDVTGVMHVAGPERLSRYEMVARFARLVGIDEPRLVAASRLEMAGAEPRPADLSLDGSRLAGKFPVAVPGAIRQAVFADAGQRS